MGEQWIVHYKPASMAESISKREEDARFMHNFDSEFVLRH